VSQAERRAVIERRLPSRDWPHQRRLLITAVDAETGEAVVFTRDSGVSLVDAVAASCAVPVVWPPVTIDGHRYIDGGVRSVANADLAAGCERVVVIAPDHSQPAPRGSTILPGARAQHDRHWRQERARGHRETGPGIASGNRPQRARPRSPRGIGQGRQGAGGRGGRAGPGGVVLAKIPAEVPCL
jgi:predicted acylesterase/phospholipase RssA